jgi:hypothetical protein
MSASITFNDGAAATLINGQNSPADRFAGWSPRTTPIGETANPQASPQLTMFRFRSDESAAFKLPLISSAGDNSKVTIARRLIAHLLNGGLCTVNTDDAATASYPNCCLTPGTKPTLALTDDVNMEYTLSVDLTSTAGTPMVCRYNG